MRGQSQNRGDRTLRTDTAMWLIISVISLFKGEAQMAVSDSIAKIRKTAEDLAKRLSKSTAGLRKKASKSAASAEATVKRELRAMDKEIAALRRSAARLKQQAKKEIAIQKRRRAAAKKRKKK